jgi:hypothetical protein
VGNLFERLSKGRPSVEEPTPTPAQKLPWPEPAQKMLAWLHRNWTEPVICVRDLSTYGPRPRNRKRVMEIAEILVAHGLLHPLKTHRYDRIAWRVAISEK